MRNALPFIVFLFGLSIGAGAQTSVAPKFTVTGAEGSLTLEYQSDRQLTRIVEELSARGGGDIHFSPGVFEFRNGIEFSSVKDIRFQGSQGTIFRLRRIEEFAKVTVTESAPLSAGVIKVENADQLVVGARYQLFRPTLEGNRLIECIIANVDGDKVTLGDSRNQLTKTAEPGHVLLPQLNFFEGFGCSNLTFSGIVFDGNCDVTSMMIGEQRFRGHTAHCGILLRNIFKGRDDFDPLTVQMPGLTVRDCRFQNLMGRGVVAYNMSGISIQNCDFEGFGAEALEIDHLTTDVTIAGNRFKDCMMGMRLNDCTAVSVTGCQLTRCEIGIHITDALHDPATNRAMVIQGNTFRGGFRGIIVDGNGEENVIQGNVLQDVLIHGIIVHGSNNIVTGNLVRGVKRIGIADYGEGNIVENNLVSPAASASRDFQAIVRDPKGG